MEVPEVVAVSSVSDPSSARSRIGTRDLEKLKSILAEVIIAVTKTLSSLASLELRNQPGETCIDIHVF